MGYLAAITILHVVLRRCCHIGPATTQHLSGPGLESTMRNVNFTCWELRAQVFILKKSVKIIAITGSFCPVVSSTNPIEYNWESSRSLHQTPDRIWRQLFNHYNFLFWRLVITGYYHKTNTMILMIMDVLPLRLLTVRIFSRTAHRIHFHAIHDTYNNLDFNTTNSCNGPRSSKVSDSKWRTLRKERRRKRHMVPNNLNLQKSIR